MSKRLHCHHSKIVKWLNQTEHTLWGSPRRDLQKDRMRLHELSHLSRKRQSICVFHKIEKKKKNQITKIGKNVMNIVQFSIALHCCIQILHLEACVTLVVTLRNESLVRHNTKFNFSPFFFLQFRAPPLSLSLPLSFPPLKYPLQASYPRLILVVKLLLPRLIP